MPWYDSRKRAESHEIAATDPKQEGWDPGNAIDQVRGPNDDSLPYWPRSTKGKSNKNNVNGEGKLGCLEILSLLFRFDSGKSPPKLIIHIFLPALRPHASAEQYKEENIADIIT